MISSEGVTLPALHQACRDGDGDALSALIEQRDHDRLELFHRINEYDSFLGWTPAHWASYHGKIECLRRLLSFGLNVDIGDGQYKRTPAHIAAFAGHPHMLLWLLQAGAEPNKQDDNGDTLVHHAARSGSNDCLNVLHSHNSYMCLSNKDGQTPKDVAMMCGFDHCAQYLSQFNSDASHSVRGNLKRSLDPEDDLNEVKRVCNGFAWPQLANGVSQGNHTSHEQCQHNTMHVESHNGHTDPAMEVQCNNTEALPAKCKEEQLNPKSKLFRLPTQLSLPHRCLGSHYM